MNWTELYTAFEIKLGAAFGLFWALIDVALGGIDAPIKALCVLMVVDFLTGVTAAYKHGELDSSIGGRGLWKKVCVFFAIGFAYCMDIAMSTNNMLRGMVISGFAIIEALSVVENVDRLGGSYIIPSFLRDKLRKIAEERVGKKGDDTNDS